MSTLRGIFQQRLRLVRNAGRRLVEQDTPPPAAALHRGAPACVIDQDLPHRAGSVPE